MTADHGALEPSPWNTLRSAPADVASILSSFRRAFEHAGDDGAAAIHVERRRADLRSEARRSLAEIEERCRLALGRARAPLEDDIEQRLWVAEDAERDSDDRTEDGTTVHRPARWPVIRLRLEDARDPEDCLRAIEQLAREFARAGDEEGLIILRYQVPGYLEHRRRWPPGRIESASRAVNAVERTLGEPPEDRLEEVLRLHGEATAARRSALAAVASEGGNTQG